MSSRIWGVRAVAAALFIAGGVASCTAGGAESSGGDDEVTLTFLTFETPNLTAEYWDDVIERTSEQVPGVTIEKLVAPSAEQRNEYVRQLDSTGELPDVMVAIDPGGLAEAGKLAEFSEDELADWIDPTANSFDGAIYQLATNSQTWQIYYNKAAFQTAGIDQPPTTWDELLADVAALEQAGITPFVIGGGAPDGLGPRWTFAQLMATEVYAEDPQWLAKLVAGEVDFSDPLFVDAATKMQALASAARVDNLSATYAEAQDAFLNGEGAMYPMGSWFPAAPDETQQQEIGVFSMPTDDGSLVLPAYTGGGLSVSASAEDVDLAKQWAIEFSRVNADGGARFDGLFVALDGYEPPSDLPLLYNETLGLLDSAQAEGTVTTSFGNEGGTPALPPGFIAEVDAALLDLLNGRADVDSFVATLNQKLTDLER
ncbi:ABC transporter substrate-binding protein [Jiangella alba]|uniref:Carbohydrate ABC transporter substrate-binding protein, CUT1 family n=1 Tax=Jiangella alba TaxID=561176 RepID=A0A1H5JDS7_9ACTN|nr:extracellular solute-binding protein [Jiangella alba]SEE50703.1 carbohydrate ABC transporter substrate-binding protein, CUT1 family [Jiangella alba]